jgi:hypothetical protein
MAESVLRREGLSAEDTQSVLDGLLAEGFLGRVEGAMVDTYEITDKGIRLAMASAAKPALRASAERAVAELVARAEAINANSQFTHYVERLRVFGSYLGDEGRIGDVDVACLIKMRPDLERLGASERWEVGAEHARASERRFGNSTDEMFWGVTEVGLALKARKRTISLMRDSNPEDLGVEAVAIFQADRDAVVPYNGPGLAVIEKAEAQKAATERATPTRRR